MGVNFLNQSKLINLISVVSDQRSLQAVRFWVVYVQICLQVVWFWVVSFRMVTVRKVTKRFLNTQVHCHSNFITNSVIQ